MGGDWETNQNLFQVLEFISGQLIWRSLDELLSTTTQEYFRNINSKFLLKQYCSPENVLKRQ